MEPEPTARAIMSSAANRQVIHSQTLAAAVWFSIRTDNREAESTTDSQEQRQRTT